MVGDLGEWRKLKQGRLMDSSSLPWDWADREFCPTGHAIQRFASRQTGTGTSPTSPISPGGSGFQGNISPWKLNISCFEEPQKGFEWDPWSQGTGLWVSEPRQNPSLDLPAFGG